MNDSQCGFEGCDKPRKSRGFCQGHYMQVLRGSTLRPLTRREPQSTCTFDGCGVVASGRGLCGGHHRQQSLGQELRPIDRNSPTVCSFPECLLPTRCKGLCAGHYGQVVKGGELRPLKRKPGARAYRQPQACIFEGCGNKVNAKGLCAGHYHQYREGRPLTALRAKQAQAAPCAVSGCGTRSVTASSGEPLCSKHQQRWQKTGDPLSEPVKLRVRPVGMAAIATAVAGRDRSGCWTDWAELPCWAGLDGWGGRNTAGYPALGGDMVMWLAMEADGRPRPSAPANNGLHSCDNAACWNPDHLRWGTRSENALDQQKQRNYCAHCEHCNPATP